MQETVICNHGLILFTLYVYIDLIVFIPFNQLIYRNLINSTRLRFLLKLKNIFYRDHVYGSFNFVLSLFP